MASVPNLAKVPQAVVFEDTTVKFLARLMVDASNVLTAAVQADFSAITYAVYSGETSIGTGTLTVSSVIYNSLQTGSIWTVDSTGFNFKATLAASLFPTGNTTYTVEFKHTLADASVFWSVFEVRTHAIATS